MKVLKVFFIVLFFSVQGFAQTDATLKAHASVTEWWHFTGNLSDRLNQYHVGYQITFFKVLGVGYLVHYSINIPEKDKFIFGRKLISPFQAKNSKNHLRLKYDQFYVEEVSPQVFLIEFQEAGNTFQLQLKSLVQKSIGIQGGKLQLPNTSAFTYLYSNPFLQSEGSARIDGEFYNLRGISWIDHQWGPFLPGYYPSQLRKSHWLSAALDHSVAVNFSQGFYRTDSESEPSIQYAVVIHSDGSVQNFGAADVKIMPVYFWKSSRTQNSYGIEWVTSIPKIKLFCHWKALQADQELYRLSSSRLKDPSPHYWEGRAQVVCQYGLYHQDAFGYIETLFMK